MVSFRRERESTTGGDGRFPRGRATGPVPGDDVQYRMGSIMDGYFAGEPLHVADGTPSHLDLASFRFSRTPYAVDADIPGGVDEGGWP